MKSFGTRNNLMVIILSVMVVLSCGPTISGIELPSDIVLQPGTITVLPITIYPSEATDKTISWSSSNSDVATVNDRGEVSALKVGTTVITAKANYGGATATCRVSVVAVYTEVATNINSRYATLNGRLLPVIEYLANDVWFLYSETASTLYALKSSGTKITSTLSGCDFFAGVSGLKHETTYYYVACAKVQNRVVYGTVVKSFTTTTAVLPAGAVDMGLSILWHQCNIGASKPEEYGDYFAWGETTTKATYNWSTYTLCRGLITTMTKYCTSSSSGTVDNKTTIEKSDDVAYQKLGGNWRMPTDAEWTELRNTDNCTWIWTTENRVNGCRVTSKKTGNSIFLPAAGDRYEVDLYGAGSYGTYWSSSLDTPRCYTAFYVGFSSSGVGRDFDYRYYGRSVRPVCDY